MHRSRPVLRAPGRAPGGALLAAAALLVGCPDPGAKYDEFLENTDDDRDFKPPPPPDVATIEADISGDFLLAISTSIDPSKPMQFLTTNTIVSDDAGKFYLSTTLQPLAITTGQVTTPRTPVGEPLVYEMIPIADGEFTVDAGTVMVLGAANPITGTDIVASLMMQASILSADLYCGEFSGMLMEPLPYDLAGSTFAAVRVDGPMALPTDVTINCEGGTVTDPP